MTPLTATLGVNCCMQATVSFTPKQVGEGEGELLLHYGTGEKVYTKLYGNAVDVNVRLDKSSVTVEDTYIGLSSHRYSTKMPYSTCIDVCYLCRTVVLHNRSDVVIRYQWKAFSTEGEEETHKEL